MYEFKQTISKMSEPKTLTIVSDADSSDQCLYIDGNVWKSSDEITVYARDLHEASDGQPVVIEWRDARLDPDGDWPELLKELRNDPTPETQVPGGNFKISQMQIDDIRGLMAGVHDELSRVEGNK